MARAVFTTKPVPDYDDLPERLYHFPKTYLNQVLAAVGDWIVYYEPRRSSGHASSRGGRQCYFATARVERIVPDPFHADHFYAEVSNYLDFTRAVPFAERGSYYESGLRKLDGSTNKGAFGRAVRLLRDEEYALIWRAGFGHVIGLEPRYRPLPDIPEAPLPAHSLVAESRDHYEPEQLFETDREIVVQLVARPFRDRAFAAAVKAAYEDRCAVSGLKIINGLGRSEVQAAHIRPVEERGPDSVRNGIALSGTIHWLFDRGLISIGEDYGLLVADALSLDTAARLLPPDRRLSVPFNPELRPHPEFLAFHRERIFKR